MIRMIEWLDKIDIKLFLFLNQFNSDFWDRIMWFASGKLSWLPLYVFLLFLIFRKYKRNFWIPVLTIVLLITLSDQASVHLFKNVFERLRPCHNPEIKSMVHLVNNRCGGLYGFVSSHAANTFSLAVFTILIIQNRILTIGMISWASLVSYSRIYMGRHYPGDMLGGAILGILIAWLLFYLFTRIYNRLARNR